MARSGRPRQDGLKLAVYRLVTAQVEAGRYRTVKEACLGLASEVGRPGGSLAGGGTMGDWLVLACVGNEADWVSEKTWEAFYAEGRRLAGHPPRGRGRPPRDGGLF